MNSKNATHLSFCPKKNLCHVMVSLCVSHTSWSSSTMINLWKSHGGVSFMAILLLIPYCISVVLAHNFTCDWLVICNKFCYLKISSLLTLIDSIFPFLEFYWRRWVYIWLIAYFVSIDPFLFCFIGFFSQFYCALNCSQIFFFS